MFSGIVAEIGIVTAYQLQDVAASLTIAASEAFAQVAIGESIAVNGVCLTVVQRHGSGFTVDISPETLRATNLGQLQAGEGVNLERALRLNDLLGGHLVSGHVDGVGTIVEKRPEANAIHYVITVPKDLQRYVVPKGSVAIDGISLTVVACPPEGVQVTIIPHTAAMTTIGRKGPGTTVNLECDLVGKYVERILHARLEDDSAERGELMEAVLRRHGLAG
jgi:riboflavin synthase